MQATTSSPLTCPTCLGPARRVNRSRWANRPIYKGQCTQRCGGGMGLFSLNQKPESATPEGECQVCMRVDLKVPEEQLISLHGFTRPGDGHVYGRCPGAQHPPFEQAKTRAEWYVREILQPEEARLESYRVRLAEPGQPEVESINWQAYVRDDVTGKSNLKFYAVANGDARVSNFLPYGQHKPSFAELVERKLEEVERDLRHLRAEIQRREQRNASWKPKTLRYSNDPKAPTVSQQERAQRQVSLANARSAKAAKKEALRQKRIAAAEETKRGVSIWHQHDGEVTVQPGSEPSLGVSADSSDCFLHILVDVAPGIQITASAHRRNDGTLRPNQVSEHIDPRAFI